MTYTPQSTTLNPSSFASSSTFTRILWIAGFTLATALAARLEIPHQPIPYTLQTFVVLLAGAFLGWRNGAISQIAYLVSGLAGIPVFAGGAFGLATLVGPTGGYLAAFPAAAALVGFLVPLRRGLLWTVAAMVMGILVIFTAGTLHLYAWYIKDFPTALMTGFLVFSWWDLLKVGAAAMIYREIAKRWARL
jgi:biotin transport system substrate-specific component